MVKLTVLDYCAGQVCSYILTEEQLEMDERDLLEKLGHTIIDCEWMYHK